MPTNRRNFLGILGYIAMVLPALIGVTPATATEPDAGAVARQMIYRNDGESLYRKITMITCRYKQVGSQRKCASHPVKKTLEALDKDIGPAKRDSLELGIIIEPTDERSMAFLQKDYNDADRDTDQWMYFPALKKLKRIVSQSPDSPKTGSVFGSEIAYEDNERMQPDDYDFTYTGKESINGRMCHIIEAVPTKKRWPKTSYGRQKIWIDQESSAPLRRELYDKRTGNLTKTFFLKKLEKHDGGAWIARMEITVNHDTGRMTLVRVDHLAVNVRIDESLFGLRALEDTSFREKKLNTLREIAH